MLEEIAARIEAELRLGFDTLAQIVDSAIDLYGGDDGYPGDDAVRALAADKFAQLLREQASWQRPTDAERLARAFTALSAAGILARHNYAPTRTWGLGDLREEAKNANLRGLPARGYVYYTSQDAEGIEDGALHLAFGAFTPPRTTFAETAQATHAVAHEIEARLSDEGLEVDWDGGVDTTIRIVDLDWKCPRDADGHGILRNERIEAPATSPSSEAPVEEASWPLTKSDEWWAVVTFIAFDGSNAAEISLEIVHDSLNPTVQATAHRAPGALDLVFPGLALAGKTVRFDLMAAPSNLLHVSSRRRAIELADVVIGIVRDPHGDFQSVEEIRESLANAKRETPVLLLVDSPAALLVDPLAAAFPYEQFRVDFEVDVAPVVSALKRAARLASSRIQEQIARG